MAITAQYTSAGLTDQAQIGTANTNLDGTGTLGTVATGTTAGKVIEGVQIKAIVTTSAGMVRFFVSYDSGTTKRLLAEVPVTAVTKSASVAAFETVWVPPFPLVLTGTTSILYAATEVANSFNVIPFGGTL